MMLKEEFAAIFFHTAFCRHHRRFATDPKARQSKVGKHFINSGQERIVAQSTRRFTMRFLAPLLCSVALTLPATAQDFTTSAGVKPILELIKGNWVAVRPYEGQDLLYFSTLLIYRFGIQQISFAYNGGPFQPLQHEPCHWGENDPMALKLETHLPYVVAPLNSLQSVAIQLDFDDGTVMSQSYQRDAIPIN